MEHETQGTKSLLADDVRSQSSFMAAMLWYEVHQLTNCPAPHHAWVLMITFSPSVVRLTWNPGTLCLAKLNL